MKMGNAFVTGIIFCLIISGVANDSQDGGANGGDAQLASFEDLEYPALPGSPESRESLSLKPKSMTGVT